MQSKHFSSKVHGVTASSPEVINTFCVYSQTAPVDKAMFLKGRATGRNMDVATLVTSEGGNIRFWCLYGARNEMGMFVLHISFFDTVSITMICHILLFVYTT